MTTPETIAELRKLLAEATPGPVTTQQAPDNDPNYLTLTGGKGFFDGFHGYSLTGFCHPFDQRYIVAALNTMPSLLSDLEAAQKREQLLSDALRSVTLQLEHLLEQDDKPHAFEYEKCMNARADLAATEVKP